MKLPRPQNRSITRCSCGLHRPASAGARHQHDLMCGFTWVKSVGLNGVVMPKSETRQFIAAFIQQLHRVRPWAATTITPVLGSKAQAGNVVGRQGSRWRNTRAVTWSPQVTQLRAGVARIHVSHQQRHQRRGAAGANHVGHVAALPRS